MRIMKVTALIPIMTLGLYGQMAIINMASTFFCFIGYNAQNCCYAFKEYDGHNSCNGHFGYYGHNGLNDLLLCWPQFFQQL